MITDRRKFTTKMRNIPLRFSSFHFYRWNQFKVIPLACTLHTRNKTSPNFLRRSAQVDNTADITITSVSQRQPANHHRLWSHVTIGPIVACRK